MQVHRRMKEHAAKIKPLQRMPIRPQRLVDPADHDRPITRPADAVEHAFHLRADCGFNVETERSVLPRERPGEEQQYE